MKRPERVVGVDFWVGDAFPGETVIVPDNHPNVLASGADREWFEQHPGVNERLRDPTPGEIRTMPIAAACVVWVEQIRPGVRLRHFLTRRPS